MYSMPQHAVTKGYWTIEYFRAQPRASSRRLVKNDVSLIMSLPIQGAVVPRVNETDHQDPEKDSHFHQTRKSQGVVHHGPWIEKDELDVEQDEQNPDQVKLDREPPY